MGAAVAPFSAGEAAYRFLPPFFFPPFAAFFAIWFIPPFVWDSCARSLLRIAAPLPSGTSAVRPYAARRFVWLRGALPSDSPTRSLAGARCPLRSRGSLAVARSQEELRRKKSGVQSRPHTPQTGQRRLALLAALFLAALCAFLRHEFLLGTWLLSYYR
jgi:hypothetical protein